MNSQQGAFRINEPIAMNHKIQQSTALHPQLWIQQSESRDSAFYSSAGHQLQ